VNDNVNIQDCVILQNITKQLLNMTLIYKYVVDLEVIGEIIRSCEYEYIREDRTAEAIKDAIWPNPYDFYIGQVRMTGVHLGKPKALEHGQRPQWCGLTPDGLVLPWSSIPP
jgi:hypothetical protein